MLDVWERREKKDFFLHNSLTCWSLLHCRHASPHTQMEEVSLTWLLEKAWLKMSRIKRIRVDLDMSPHRIYLMLQLNWEDAA